MGATRNHISNWSKFQLLMWKNWLLIKRQKVQTTLEILIPLVFSACLVLIRGVSGPEFHDKPFIYKSLDIVNTTWDK